MKPRQWMRIAAVASAVGFCGTAIANDMNTPSAQSATGNDGTAITQATPGMKGNAAADLNNGVSSDLNRSNAASDANANRGADLNNSAADFPRSAVTDLNRNEPSDLSNGVPSSATPSSATAPSATSSGEATASPGDQHWANDTRGRVTREQFLDEMARRFDALDTQHRGSLAPAQIEEILVVTAPATPSAAPSGTSSSIGNADTSSDTAASDTTSTSNSIAH